MCSAFIPLPRITQFTFFINRIYISIANSFSSKWFSLSYYPFKMKEKTKIRLNSKCKRWTLSVNLLFLSSFLWTTSVNFTFLFRPLCTAFCVQQFDCFAFGTRFLCLFYCIFPFNTHGFSFIAEQTTGLPPHIVMV